MAILFFSEDTDFRLDKIEETKDWLTQVAHLHCLVYSEEQDLNYIFCSDDYLHQINVEYLQHDTLTDVITFDHAEKAHELAGDIYISIDRVRENANEFACSFQDELHRVLAHGLLHLIGFGDKTKEESLQMRTKEDEALMQRKF